MLVGGCTRACCFRGWCWWFGDGLCCCCATLVHRALWLIAVRNMLTGGVWIHTGGERVPLPLAGIGCGAGRVFTTDTSESARNQPILSSAMEIGFESELSILKTNNRGIGLFEWNGEVGSAYLRVMKRRRQRRARNVKRNSVANPAVSNHRYFFAIFQATTTPINNVYLIYGEHVASDLIRLLPSS